MGALTVPGMCLTALMGVVCGVVGVYRLVGALIASFLCQVNGYMQYAERLLRKDGGSWLIFPIRSAFCIGFSCLLFCPFYTRLLLKSVGRTE
jgi:hypothetical protein